LLYSFITEQTCYGLKVSLKTTLEISFLIHKCKYEYLTSRLNQDNLGVYIFFNIHKIFNIYL